MKFLQLILLIIFISSCATPSQIFWDRKVKSLCEKDGGVTVFEYINLTNEEYHQRGGQNDEIPMPIQKYAKSSDPYYIAYSMSVIKEGDLSVQRSTTKIIRQSDAKELAVLVNYVRAGGDIPNGISYPSHYSCRDIPGIITDLGKSILRIGEI